MRLSVSSACASYFGRKIQTCSFFDEIVIRSTMTASGCCFLHATWASTPLDHTALCYSRHLPPALSVSGSTGEIQSRQALL